MNWAHAKAVDELLRKQPNSDKYVNPVVQQWADGRYRRKTSVIPKEFAGEMCLVRAFEGNFSSRRIELDSDSDSDMD